MQYLISSDRRQAHFHVRHVLSRKKKKIKFQFIVKENAVLFFIANKIKRSRTVVSNFIKNPELYGRTKRPSRPKLTATVRRRLLREASKGNSCSKEQKLQLDVTPRLVRQVLNQSSNLVYRTRKKAPALTKQHKEKRMKWVKKKSCERWVNG